MNYIVVDEEQAKLIAETSQGVEIRDKQGKHLGFVAHSFSDEDVAIAKMRLQSNEPRLSTKEILDFLGTLDKK